MARTMVFRSFCLAAMLSVAYAFTAAAVPRQSMHTSSSTTTSSLHMAYSGSSLLKPAAIPLMDSGKALARSGELLIELTEGPALNNYGGSLSSAGANLRNAGDCVAQAAASCRFKTGTELVSDELREAGVCLLGAADDKLPSAVKEVDDEVNAQLAKVIESTIAPVGAAGAALEAAGAEIMMKTSVANVGSHIAVAGTQILTLSLQLKALVPDDPKAELCSQRMAFAGERMVEAGNALQVMPGTKKTATKGKGWIKG